jgi:hypothetical protein
LLVKRRVGIGIAIIGGAALIWLGFHVSGPQEPRYKGLPLSRWMDIYSGRVDMSGSSGSEDPRIAAQKEAREAFRAIGTNAIPWLLKWMSVRKPPGGDVILKLADWKPTERPMAPAIRWMYDRGEHAIESWIVFEVLGEQASNAVPELTRLLNTADRNKQWPLAHVQPSAVALAFIGKAGIVPLGEYLERSGSAERIMVVRFLISAPERVGTNAAVLAPALVKGLGGTNVYFATLCAEALGKFKVDDGVAVPKLIAYLSSGEARLVLASIGALEQMGPGAKAAVPKLTQLKQSADTNISVAAERAVDRISDF